MTNPVTAIRNRCHRSPATTVPCTGGYPNCRNQVVHRPGHPPICGPCTNRIRDKVRAEGHFHPHL